MRNTNFEWFAICLPLTGDFLFFLVFDFSPSDVRLFYDVRLGVREGKGLPVQRQR